ncbi:TetR/AcrR family transcriptional regulator [Nocardia yamanashiensis]|uniref:TetR/AcrR family transcriptional regulator n=1 Tax=Nocardia yamanashiensis TaxID=209247 RepID=UPI001E4A3DDD|nr:TetR/AcrR family transcriptional regulator [Nocardia yamanashiensis]UGT44033.1 TetR/AcrR family transcriptional regulator [Nocardia yamanashiensis]
MSDKRIQILEAAVRVIAQDGVRGLRIEKLAAEASVSAGLIYHYFGGRAGVLHSALVHLDERAVAHIDAAPENDCPLATLESMLLVEIDDSADVRRNCVAWGELRASAVFTPDLREPLRTTTQCWIDHVADVIGRAMRPGTPGLALDAAERLTALVEGLTARWLSGSASLESIRRSLSGAIVTELGPRLSR